MTGRFFVATSCQTLYHFKDPHPVVLIPPNITDTAPINNNVMMGTEKTTAGTENSPHLTCGKLVLALGMGTE